MWSVNISVIPGHSPMISRSNQRQQDGQPLCQEVGNMRLPIPGWILPWIFSTPLILCGCCWARLFPSASTSRGCRFHLNTRSVSTLSISPEAYGLLQQSKAIHSPLKRFRNASKGNCRFPPSKEYLGQEVDNIVAAFNLIAERLATEEFPLLTVDLIKQFNKSVLDKLEVDPEVKPGEIREHSVGVAHYLGAPAEDCEFLLEKLCSWLNEPVFLPDGANSMMYGILRAIIAHLYLAWIHPFGDGNGRTARLIEVQILLATGVPSPAAHLLSNHYNLTRSVYYRQLDASSKPGVGVLPFVQYALQGFVDGLKEQIHTIREQQWEVAWRQFIFDNFPGLSSETDKRRRDLALEITKATMKDYNEPIPLNKVRQISATVAQLYTNKTYRTILRDIEILSELQLVEVSPKGVRPKREMILQFLPRRRDQAMMEPQTKEARKTRSK